MNAPTRHKNGKASSISGRPGKLPRSGSGRTLLPALIALGGGSLLAAGPAAALQLGELRVQSSLGQPLRASIAYALNPDEHVQSHCIRLGGSRAASGLPGIRDARISVRDNFIRLTGRAPVNDPLMALTVNVDCPGTARISREYTAFIEPPGTAESANPEAAAASTEPAARPTATARDRAATTSARTAPPPRPPVAAGTYRVEPGDSLSGIAARIADRRMGLWATVDALFAANPGAFIDGNRDLLLAGSELVIPAAVLEPGSSEPVRAGPAPSADRSATAEPAPAQPRQETPATETAGTPASAARTAPAAAEPPATAAPPRQGDVSPDSDGPFVAPIEPEAVSPPVETAANEPAPVTTVPPAVSRPAFSASEDRARSRSWLMWLGGSGAALILALLLFGRQLKERFAAAAPSASGRRGAESDDTTVVARTALDASSMDVDTGDGNFGDSGDIDLAQEFGYTVSGETGNDARIADPFGSTAILESEILPSDETGEYDLSMIVDATQQELPDAEDTTRDLRAIQLEEDESDEPEGEYTLSRDLDYRVLEQDYQDELTATQALNAELTRAARDMSLEIEVDEETSHPPADSGDDDTLGATAVLPEDPDNASASTIEMRPGGDEAGAEQAAEDEREDTRSDEDLTSTMGDAENDPTAETDETKKLRAS